MGLWNQGVKSNGSRPIRLRAQDGVKESRERVNGWILSSSVGLIQRNLGRCYRECSMHVLSQSKRNGRIRLQINPGVYYTWNTGSSVDWDSQPIWDILEWHLAHIKGDTEGVFKGFSFRNFISSPSFSLYYNFPLLSSPFSLHLLPLSQTQKQPWTTVVPKSLIEVQPGSSNIQPVFIWMRNTNLETLRTITLNP